MIDAAKKLLDKDKRYVYYLLCGLAVAMGCIECSRTSQFLEQATRAFYCEGQRHE